MDSTNIQQSFTQLLTAIKLGSFEQAELLLRIHGEILANRLDPQFNQPPLYFAALIEGDDISLQIIKLLIRSGANYKFKDQNEQTVLFYLCREGKEKCVELLLTYGLSLDDVDIYGQTPIFYAINQNKIEIVRKYATKQRVNHIDNLAKQTPLYYAARRGHLQLCKILIQKGADITHSDMNGKTAIQFAKKAKYAQVAQLLNHELRRTKQVSKFSMPSYSIEQSNLEKKKKKQQNLRIQRQTYKIVHYDKKGQVHDLTQQQVRLLIKQIPDLQNYLSNPQSIPQELIQNSQNSDWQRIAIKITGMCSKLKGSFWFAEPVDPVKFNIIDYFDIIQSPMDLSTVRKKLNYNCYSSASEYVRDMNLIWQNCYKYNGQTHDISKCARQLQVNFNEYLNTYELSRYLQNK